MAQGFARDVWRKQLTGMKLTPAAYKVGVALSEYMHFHTLENA